MNTLAFGGRPSQSKMISGPLSPLNGFIGTRKGFSVRFLHTSVSCVVMPWMSSCHGGLHAMEVFMPWRSSCHGGLHAMEVVMPWRSSCHGGLHAMEVVMPWRSSCHGSLHARLSIKLNTKQMYVITHSGPTTMNVCSVARISQKYASHTWNTSYVYNGTTHKKIYFRQLLIVSDHAKLLSLPIRNRPCVKWHRSKVPAVKTSPLTSRSGGLDRPNIWDDASYAGEKWGYHYLLTSTQARVKNTLVHRYLSSTLELLQFSLTQCIVISDSSPGSVEQSRDISVTLQ